MEKKIELVQVSVVRNADGTLNFETTLKNCQATLTASENIRTASNAKFGGIMTQIFDEYKGLGVDMQTLASEIVNRLEVSLDERPALTKSALDFIRGVTGERGKALYGSQKGKGKLAGTFRWADVPEKAPEQAAK